VSLILLPVGKPRFVDVDCVVRVVCLTVVVGGGVVVVVVVVVVGGGVLTCNMFLDFDFECT
jgi:hypothetical protein